MNLSEGMPRALATRAGGFIGHHMTSFLGANGYWERNGDNGSRVTALGWRPSAPLQCETYRRIEKQLVPAGRTPQAERASA